MFVSPRHCQYVSTDEDAHSSELTVTSRADMVTWTESSRLLRGRKLEAAAGRTPAPRSHPIPSRPREPRGLPAAMPGTARFFHLRDDRAPPLSTGDWTPIHACRLRAGSAQVSRLSRTANERPRGRTLPRGPVAVRSPSSRLAPGGGRRTGDSRAFRSQSNRRRVMARPLFFFHRPYVLN